MRAGRLVEQQIKRAISEFDRLLVILSHAALCSEWVQLEIRAAFQKQMEQKSPVLFPIRLIELDAIKRWTLRDPTTGKDLARTLAQYFIPDFRNWRDTSVYHEAMGRLVADLLSRTDATMSYAR
jgi:hypothetical protein